MKNKLRLFISGILTLMLGLTGFVVLAIFTRTEPELDADWLSPTAPFFFSDEQLTARSLTRTQVATYDPSGTRFWQRRTQMADATAQTAIQSATNAALTYEFIQNLTAVMDARLQSTATPTPAPNLTPDFVSCGWMWATRQNPALSAEIQAQLAAYREISEVRAEAFGENCLNPDGSIRYFATMQTDFRLYVRSSIQSEDMATVQAHLSPLVTEILSVLAQYPQESTPGNVTGNIWIEFTHFGQSGQVEYWLWADYGQAITALEQGLTGPALFDALGGLNRRDAIQPT